MNEKFANFHFPTSPYYSLPCIVITLLFHISPPRTTLAAFGSDPAATGGGDKEEVPERRKLVVEPLLFSYTQYVHTFVNSQFQEAAEQNDAAVKINAKRDDGDLTPHAGFLCFEWNQYNLGTNKFYQTKELVSLTRVSITDAQALGIGETNNGRVYRLHTLAVNWRKSRSVRLRIVQELLPEVGKAIYRFEEKQPSVKQRQEHRFHLPSKSQITEKINNHLHASDPANSLTPPERLLYVVVNGDEEDMDTLSFFLQLGFHLHDLSHHSYLREATSDKAPLLWQRLLHIHDWIVGHSRSWRPNNEQGKGWLIPPPPPTNGGATQQRNSKPKDWILYYSTAWAPVDIHRRDNGLRRVPLPSQSQGNAGGSSCWLQPRLFVVRRLVGARGAAEANELYAKVLGIRPATEGSLMLGYYFQGVAKLISVKSADFVGDCSKPPYSLLRGHESHITNHFFIHGQATLPEFNTPTITTNRDMTIENVLSNSFNELLNRHPTTAAIHRNGSGGGGTVVAVRRDYAPTFAMAGYQAYATLLRSGDGAAVPSPYLGDFTSLAKSSSSRRAGIPTKLLSPQEAAAMQAQLCAEARGGGGGGAQVKSEEELYVFMSRDGFGGVGEAQRQVSSTACSNNP